MPDDSSHPVRSDPPADAGTAVRDRVVEVLRTCYDPEIPVNIYDLGLIYDVDVDLNRDVDIRMTLTSPACPVAGSLPPEVESRVRALSDVRDDAGHLVAGDDVRGIGPEFTQGMLRPRVLAAQVADITAADAAVGHPDKRLPAAGLGFGHVFDDEVFPASQYDGFHVCHPPDPTRSAGLETLLFYASRRPARNRRPGKTKLHGKAPKIFPGPAEAPRMGDARGTKAHDIFNPCPEMPLPGGSAGPDARVRRGPVRHPASGSRRCTFSNRRARDCASVSGDSRSLSAADSK